MTTTEEPEQSAKRFRNPALNLGYRIAIGVVGTVVVIVGIILIPYPGPGWLVVFAGLAILATEFAWAQRALEYAKGRYDAWIEWLKRQSTSVKSLVVAATCFGVIVSLWMFGGLELAGGLVGVEESSLASPIF